MWINKRSIDRKQQINIEITERFRSKEVIKIALIANDVKRIGQLILLKHMHMEQAKR